MVKPTTRATKNATELTQSADHRRRKSWSVWNTGVPTGTGQLVMPAQGLNRIFLIRVLKDATVFTCGCPPWHQQRPIMEQWPREKLDVSRPAAAKARARVAHVSDRLFRQPT